MGNVMNVLIHAKQVMKDNTAYNTVEEWLKEEGRDAVSKILYDHIKDKMESYMLGNYKSKRGKPMVLTMG